MTNNDVRAPEETQQFNVPQGVPPNV